MPEGHTQLVAMNVDPYGDSEVVLFKSQRFDAGNSLVAIPAALIDCDNDPRLSIGNLSDKPLR